MLGNYLVASRAVLSSIEFFVCLRETEKAEMLELRFSFQNSLQRTTQYHIQWIITPIAWLKLEVYSLPTQCCEKHHLYSVVLLCFTLSNRLCK
jgi:hypothetical protein